MFDKARPASVVCRLMGDLATLDRDPLPPSVIADRGLPRLSDIDASALAKMSTQRRRYILLDLVATNQTVAQLARKYECSEHVICRLKTEAEQSGEYDMQSFQRIVGRSFARAAARATSRAVDALDGDGVTDGQKSGDARNYALTSAILFDKALLAASLPSTIVEMRSPQRHGSLAEALERAQQDAQVIDVQEITPAIPITDTQCKISSH